MTVEPDSCQGGLNQFIHRDLAAWTGLSGRCAEDDVARWVSLRDGEGVTRLGSERIEYRFRVAEAPEYTEPLRLMFRDGTLCLIRTGLLSTDRGECQRLLRDLGDPPDRLDLVFGMGVIAGGEWVYASRGLTLGVIPDTGLIAAVSGYRPTSADAYRRQFHSSEPAREFPRPREL